MHKWEFKAYDLSVQQTENGKTVKDLKKRGFICAGDPVASPNTRSREDADWLHSLLSTDGPWGTL